MSLQILYQDDSMVAINKPAGWLVHPADNPQDDDLVAMKTLRDQIGQHLYPIHRLDRPTSGCLIFGLEKAASTRLINDFAQRQVNKTYHAIIRGIPEALQWDCHEPIQKKDGAPYRDAHTRFRLLKSRRHPALRGLGTTYSDSDTLTLVSAEPKTGRYHQIRRHLLHARMPIVGDFRYAGMEDSYAIDTVLELDTRMLLQAVSIELNHPVSEERIMISVEMDPYFKKLGFQEP